MIPILQAQIIPHQGIYGVSRDSLTGLLVCQFAICVDFLMLCAAGVVLRVKELHVAFSGGINVVDQIHRKSVYDI